MPLVAYRGGAALADEIELKAHLASLLRLENIAALLGAGASASAGGSTMKAMWSDFLWMSPAEADWLRANTFISPAERNPSTPRPANAPAVAPPPPPPLPPGLPLPPLPPPQTPNIELLADSLEIAIIEWDRQQSPAADPARRARAALIKAVLRAAKLKDELWSSATGDVANDGLDQHRSLLQKLTSARQPGQSPPWIFTTNYDLAIEWAAEAVDIQVINGFLGVHNRRFSPQSFDLGLRNIQARGEARFGAYNIYLAKLHGSLTWKEADNDLFEVPASQAWPDLKGFLDGSKPDLGYRVLPRAAKYLQTIGYVLGELFRRFAEFLARPQAALIIAGYGFGDEHINRLIRSALLNPTLQLVIYLPEFTGNAMDPALPPTVRRLLSLQNPRLTIVGGGADAYFSKLVEQLPNPVIFDENLSDLERRLRPRDPDSTGSGGEQAAP